MRNIFAIVGRELRAYFVSPVAYVVLTAFSFITGLFFVLVLIEVDQYARNQVAQNARFGGAPQPVDVPGIVLGNYLNTIQVLLLFLLPMITMSLFSEEKRRGTIELLLTSPLRDIETVMGKFLSGFSFFAIMMAVSFLPLISLFVFSRPDIGPFIAGYLGVLLFGASLISIGLFISAMTESQIIAAMLTYVAILFLWFINALGAFTTAGTREILEYLSIIGHMEDFLKGVISTPHVIFYLSLMGLGLFLTYRSVESLRWRG